MVNMTIAVDEEVLRKARIVALEPRYLARFAVVASTRSSFLGDSSGRASAGFFLG
jgi:hypothetical protein